MDRQSRRSLRREFLLAPEGTVFLLGCLMLVGWVGAIVLLWHFQHPLWSHVLTMGFAQTIAGRAAAIAQGTQVGMNRGLIILLATYADMVFVFLAYPPLIFSYRNVLQGRFFEKHLKPVLESAEKRSEHLSRFEIAGIFLFVWLPFHMTGVLVGAVIGYLLGLKTWVNLATVTLATMTASVCWVFAYDQLFQRLGRIHPLIPVVVTAGIIGGLVIAQWASRRRELRRAEGARVQARRVGSGPNSP